MRAHTVQTGSDAGSSLAWEVKCISMGVKLPGSCEENRFW
jgi:hypothetical protein